ncbi:MAG: response regulator [Spartobacteria bacterium]|nr:response regulator [Spartobacteria bacterium]
MANLSMLVVEDESVTRKLMTHYLAPYGTCDAAEDGNKALDIVRDKLKRDGRSYDLITLDISMPGMDGQTCLREIRKLEREHRIDASDTARVLMTTLKNDPKNIMQAFQNQCEVYLVKPVTKEHLIEQLVELGLIDE